MFWTFCIICKDFNAGYCGTLNHLVTRPTILLFPFPGGLQELIGLIKSASVPIICMCNDRNSQKMRSLVNYCYDLRFNRPKVEQIKV